MKWMYVIRAAAIVAIMVAAIVATTACRYVRQDDRERTRRAFAQALVESACAPPPPDAQPIERSARAALCLAATLLAEVSESGGAQ